MGKERDSRFLIVTVTMEGRGGDLPREIEGWGSWECMLSFLLAARPCAQTWATSESTDFMQKAVEEHEEFESI